MSGPYGAFQPIVDLADNWRNEAHDLMSGDAIKRLLGMTAPPQQAQQAPAPNPYQMNWTPQASPEQQQEIEHEQPLHQMKKPLPKGK